MDPSDEERGTVLSHPLTARIARWGIISWSFIGLLILTYLIFRYVLHPVRIIFPPLLLALMVIYLLNPIVSALQNRGIPRVWGALLTYVLFFSILGVTLNLLIPIMGNQVSGFVQQVPGLLARVQRWLAEINQRWDLNIDARAVIRDLGPEGGAGKLISRIFSFTAGVVHVALVFVLGAILAFYLLVDLPKIGRAVMMIVPTRRGPEVRSILEKMGKALGGFFRGQLLVALFVGLASMVGLFIVGLPYWALVGMVAGLFNLIPLVGPFIGAVPALFIALTTTHSTGVLHLEPGAPLAIGAVIALLIVQQIDNHIISPNVVARTVKLHPVTVMLGLLIGGTLLGLWGMLLAVPTIASIKILLLYYWDTRQWPPRVVEEDLPQEPPRPEMRPGLLSRRGAPDRDSPNGSAQVAARVNGRSSGPVGRLVSGLMGRLRRTGTG